MPPPPKPSPGSAHDWLDRARGKLALAQTPLPSGGYWEDLCFQAQQAAELAIKAVYQQLGLTFRFVHDLATLLDGLKRNGLVIPASVDEADQLTVYAAQTRYPGLYAPVSEAEYDEAVRIADEVVKWATTQIP